MAAGAGVALWQAHRAIGERRQKDLLSQASSAAQGGPGRPLDPDIKVRTALDRAAARLTGKFDAQPAVEGAIRQTIGDTYMELGLYQESELQMTRALDLRRRVLGAEHGDTMKSTQALSDLYQREGKYDAAEALLQKFLEVNRRQGRGNTPEAIAVIITLARIAGDSCGDWARAEALYLRVLEVARRVLGESDALTLATMNNLAARLTREAKYSQAEELYLKLVDIKQRVLGADHPSTLASMNGLGVLYRNEGKYEEAGSRLRSALEARRRVIGEQHRDTLASMNGLGFVSGGREVCAG